MDPDANLTEAFGLADSIIDRLDSVADDESPAHVLDLVELAGDAGRLAELFQALDAWLRNGGFLATAWSRS